MALQGPVEFDGQLYYVKCGSYRRKVGDTGNKFISKRIYWIYDQPDALVSRFVLISYEVGKRLWKGQNEKAQNEKRASGNMKRTVKRGKMKTGFDERDVHSITTLFRPWISRLDLKAKWSAWSGAWQTCSTLKVMMTNRAHSWLILIWRYGIRWKWICKYVCLK